VLIASDDLDLAARRVGYRNGRRYRARAGFVFDRLDLAGKRVLDVGCGPGTWSLWAGLNGAASVLGIEPEAEGSTAGVLDTFRGTVADLRLTERVEGRAAYLQEVTAAEGPFDVAVLYNVINHIDEDAVQRLPDPGAAAAFTKELDHLATLMAPGGVVVVADVGRTNVWPRLGLTSPFAPTIEWAKHADPDVWTGLFRTSGFGLVDLRWSPHYPLGALTANRPVQYLTSSHFVLRFTAP
jgi:2-polyprenyl-3-methyl-5-hydroxy-6-metoxy-1,4-benzoquinol methylase